MQAKIKTTATAASVTDFIERLKDPVKKIDSYTLITLMKEVTGCEPTMWGPSIIGFDSYHYVYESGREGDIAAAGFSPRTNALTIYVLTDLPQVEKELKHLGPHKVTKACLYTKRLSDIDMQVLRRIIELSYRYTKAHDGAMHRAHDTKGKAI